VTGKKKNEKCEHMKSSFSFKRGNFDQNKYRKKVTRQGVGEEGLSGRGKSTKEGTNSNAKWEKRSKSSRFEENGPHWPRRLKGEGEKAGRNRNQKRWKN